NYNMTILNAVEEVENAITRYNAALQEVETLKETVAYSEEALRLALDTYKQGLSSMTDVVTSLQSYLQYQNSLVTARGETLAQLVSLYQAMGGGY
ncbi:MAG: TolC family protein, partial [Muribaculaceae bacterium]|nr:TolC family protein [Muribaculaceae bacterium]